MYFVPCFFLSSILHFLCLLAFHFLNYPPLLLIFLPLPLSQTPPASHDRFVFSPLLKLSNFLKIFRSVLTNSSLSLVFAFFLSHPSLFFLISDTFPSPSPVPTFYVTSLSLFLPLILFPLFPSFLFLLLIFPRLPCSIRFL